MNFAYYIFLLLIIFLCIFILKKNLNVSPTKIKIYLTIVITLFLLRHISLFLICILESSNYLYYLKSILYLDHIAIPLIVLAITYVYQRSETLKFTINYLIFGLVAFIYAAIMHAGRVSVQVSHLYGFIIRTNNEDMIFLFSLILMGMLLVWNVILLDKPFINKKGIWLIIFSIVVVMIEEVTVIGGVMIFPYSVIGEVIFLIITNFVLNGFKKLKSH